MGVKLGKLRKFLIGIIGFVVLSTVLGCVVPEPTPEPTPTPTVVPPTPRPTATARPSPTPRPPTPTASAADKTRVAVAREASEVEAAIVEVSGRVLDMLPRIDTLTATVCPSYWRPIARDLHEKAAIELGEYEYRIVNDPSYSSPHKQLEELQRLEGVLQGVLGSLEANCLR